MQQDPQQLARRQYAAQLLEAVIDERMEPRLAINRWPEPVELPDPSLDAAWQALWHFEADEDKQQTEMFYLDAQLELLRQMALHLKAGRDLPAYFLRTYPEEHQVQFFYDISPVEDSLNTAKRLKAQFLHFWETICRLNPLLSQTRKLPR